MMYIDGTEGCGNADAVGEIQRSSFLSIWGKMKFARQKVSEIFHSLSAPR